VPILQTDVGTSYKDADCIIEVRIADGGQRVRFMIEEDGNAHAPSRKNGVYLEADELKRMETNIGYLQYDDEDVLVFALRYMPVGSFSTGTRRDGDKPNSNKALRLIIVRTWIIWMVKRLLKTAAMERRVREARNNHQEETLRARIPVTPRTLILYLFYPHDNVHKKMAMTKYADSTSTMVGFTNSPPQERTDIRQGFDWRYCLSACEAVMMTLAARDGYKTGILPEKVSWVFPRLDAAKPEDDEVFPG
jgi:hypothetical protein